MKKRILSILLVFGLVLTLSASAWAASVGLGVYNSSTGIVSAYNNNFADGHMNEDYEQTLQFAFTQDSANKVYTQFAMDYFLKDKKYSSDSEELKNTDTTYDLKNGTLKAVVTFDPTVTPTIANLTVSGRPTKYGSSTFYLVRRSYISTHSTSSIEITINVKHVSTGSPTITGTLSQGTHGNAYSVTFKAGNNLDENAKAVPITIAEDSDTNESTLSSTYGITLSHNASGDLTLTSNKLLKTTGIDGIDLTLFLSNDTYETDRTYTLVINPRFPDIISYDEKPASTDLGTYTVSEDKDLTFTFKTNEATEGAELEASGYPDGLTWAQTETTADSNGLKALTYTLKGKPEEAGTFTIRITGTNDNYDDYDYSYTKNFTMTVLDKPVLAAPAEDSVINVKYGSTSSTTFTAGNGTKSYPVTIEANTIPEFMTYTTTSKTTDANGKGTLAIPNKAKFGATHLSALEKFTGLDYGFGSFDVVSKEITFTLKSDKFNDINVTRVLQFTATKPVLNKTGTTAPNLVKDKTLLTVGKELKASKKVNVVFDAPGIIEWSADNLPEGLSLSITPAYGSSTATIVGTPQKTAANQKATIYAANGAGMASTTVTFALINGPAPVIEQVTDTAKDTAALNDLSGDFTVGQEVQIVVVNTSSSDVKKWTLNNNPGGLKITLSGDNRAVITGKLTKANSTTYTTKPLEIVGQDGATNNKGTLQAKNFVVYAVPKITASKLPDLKIGSQYSGKVTGTSAASWDIEFDGTVFSDTNFKVESTDLNSFTITGSIDQAPGVTSASIIVTAWSPAGAVSKDFKVKITGTAPKFTTTKLSNYLTNGGTDDKHKNENEVEVTGTGPITLSAYVASKDAKSAGFPEALIDLTEDNDTKIKADVTSNAKKVTLTNNATADDRAPAIKALKITIAADNGLTNKPVTKTYSVAIDGVDPAWYYVDGTNYLSTANSKDITFGWEIGKSKTFSFKISGDNPITVSWSGNTTQNGITITSSDTNKTVTIATPTATDVTKKSKITLTAKNTATGKSAKAAITLQGVGKPVIKTVPNLKPVVKGGGNLTGTPKLTETDKTVKWYLNNVALSPAASGITSADIIALHGIKIDESKGTITISKGVITSADSKAASLDIKIVASNDAGVSDPATIRAQINPAAPSISKNTFTFTRVPFDDDNISEDKRTITARGADSPDLTWYIGDTAITSDTSLANYGLTGLSLTPKGVFVSTTNNTAPTYAVKNAKIEKVKVAYLGGESKPTTIRVTITDPKTATLSASGLSTGNALTVNNPSYEVKGKKAVIADGITPNTVTFTMSDTPSADDKTKITWKVTGSPKGFTVAFANKTTTGSSAGTNTLTITPKKGTAITSKDGEIQAQELKSTVYVTATNSNNSYTTPRFGISLDIVYTKGATATLDVEDAESTNEEITETTETSEATDEVVAEELTKELGEGDLSLGAERTESSLTAEQKALIESEGYIIAAILPEISATADGQYGLEVDLVEAAPTGAELKYLAFPQNAEPSEDDEIADFFDIDGADTETVPADHVVLVYPWLREGVTYAPVIVVKVETTDEVKDSLEDAEEGETVSAEAIEEAVEEAADANAGEGTADAPAADSEKTEAPAEAAETSAE